MDSLTQITLGAAVAAACVPKGHRRKAVFIGAALGTLPDLDVLIDYGDAVSNFTYHRGFSHSLFVLLPLSILLWALLRCCYGPVRDAPRPWLWAISLALLTHPILDAHTAYGTQLFWPISSPPIMWSTVFIIDPLYTLPLLVGAIWIAFKPDKPGAHKALLLGLVLSNSYLIWTWAAKNQVNQKIVQTVGLQHEGDQVFSTPILFTSLLWRVVVLQEQGYLEGYYSLLDPDKPINFIYYPRSFALFEGVEGLADVQRLSWFSQGFIKAGERDEQVVITDLRMGYEGNYVFNHVVARVDGDGYRAVKSELMPVNYTGDSLSFLWKQMTAP